MRKQELFKSIISHIEGDYHQAPRTPYNVQAVLSALTKALIDILERDGEVLIPGVVKIQLKNVRARPARMGRNPATGKSVPIAAKAATTRIFVRPVSNFCETVQEFKKIQEGALAKLTAEERKALGLAEVA